MEDVKLYHGTASAFKPSEGRLMPGKSGRGFYTYTEPTKILEARQGGRLDREKSKVLMEMVADRLIVKEFKNNAEAMKYNKDFSLQRQGYTAMKIKDEIVILDTKVLREVSRY